MKKKTTAQREKDLRCISLSHSQSLLVFFFFHISVLSFVQYKFQMFSHWTTKRRSSFSIRLCILFPWKKKRKHTLFHTPSIHTLCTLSVKNHRVLHTFIYILCWININSSSSIALCAANASHRHRHRRGCGRRRMLRGYSVCLFRYFYYISLLEMFRNRTHRNRRKIKNNFSICENASLCDVRKLFKVNHGIYISRMQTSVCVSSLALSLPQCVSRFWYNVLSAMIRSMQLSMLVCSKCLCFFFKTTL